VKVRATDLLCKVATEEEAMEYCAAFMQLYREEAHYLERTAPWIERVGLAYIKENIVEDAERRKALYERFVHAQQIMQKDPWAEITNDEASRRDFEPLKIAEPSSLKS